MALDVQFTEAMAAWRGVVGTLPMVETSQEDSRMDRIAANLGSDEGEERDSVVSSSSRPQLLSSPSSFDDENSGRRLRLRERRSAQLLPLPQDSGPLAWMTSL